MHRAVREPSTPASSSTPTCYPQTLAVLAHPGRAARHRARRRRPATPSLPRRRVLRGLAAAARRRRGGASTGPTLIAAGARARRAGRGRRRPAGADAAHARPASSAPTSRSARTQRFGVPMGFGGPHAGYLAVHAEHARQLPGRLVGVSHRRRRRAGLPARAADPRAAHPPREGDLQHLHRAGAAGHHRRRCTRSTTAPDGLRRDRPAGARHARARWPPGWRAGGVDVVHDTFFDTVAGVGCPAGQRRSRAAARGARYQPALGRRRPRSVSPSTRRRRRDTSRPCCDAFGWLRRRRSAEPPTATADPAPPAAAPRRREFLTQPVFTRLPHARPRCCATCAGSPTRTSRSTAR